ncbi:MAG: sulfatase [Proteobacteria bacterium]|nr:sulfatase [Pseudomonadota bacterium]MBU1740817.1 sulfatase [Pseudomonadota bacterium]
MNRRRAIKMSGGLLAAGLAGLTRPGLTRGAGSPPNVIFILSDDHRWDCLGKMKHAVVETPHLDGLCRQGVHFQNAFVTTSLCSPSRASFLTGQYAHTHGVRNNLTPWSNSNVTFLEILKQEGYDTSFIGKWHMPGGLPKLKGVDRFITFTARGGQGLYFNCPLVVNGRTTPSRKAYITEELTDYALEFMSRRRSGPFCLYLSHKAVHQPFSPPPAMSRLYHDKKLPLPPEADSWIPMHTDMVYYGMKGTLEQHFRNYLRSIHALDQQIGRVLHRVEQMGIADNTIIIYCGDNGFLWGEHRLVDKRWPYEESIRVPFIVRDPRAIKDPGRTEPRMVLNIDVAPTILDLAGLRVPANMEGRSLAPLLKGTTAPWRQAWLYEYFKDFPYRVPEMQGVRTERYKYIDYQGDVTDQLFDLKNDPREQRNLIQTEAGRAMLPRLRTMLADLRKGKMR